MLKRAVHFDFVKNVASFIRLMAKVLLAGVSEF